MQRALAPKRQVTEIERFVRQCGGQPKHSEVMELVARLSGAANWNALQGRGQAESAPVAIEVVPPLYRAGIRDVDVVATKAYFIGATMFDETEPWFLMTAVGGGEFERERELEEEELMLIHKEGVVVEAQVLYPRTDRHGLPDVAISLGFLEWLHDEQQLSSCSRDRFQLFADDSGDDSPATCVLTVRLPKHCNIR